MDLALAISPLPRRSELMLQVGPLNAVNASSLAAHPVVLRFIDPPVEGAIPRSPQVDALVTERMSRLVDMVGQLRSPDSGWPSDQPQTAEAIAPYVLEEVEDVIAAWQAAQGRSGNQAPAPVPPDLTGWQEYVLLDSLEAWLVWTAARSAYETMRLLEGMAASVASPGMAQRRGIVRLAMVVELQFPHHRWEMDLVTRQSPPTLLPLDAILHTPDDGLCHPALEVGRLLQTVTTQIRATTPDAGRFLNGVQVDCLVPHYPWQTGLLQIRLGLQFIPDGLDPVGSERISEPLAMPPSDAQDQGGTTPILPRRLQVSDMAWKQGYQDRVIQQQLASLLNRTRLFAGTDDGPTAPPSIPTMIDEAIALVDPLKTLLALTGRLCLLEELTMEDWMTRLLWYFNRSSRETMQLMGGVSAQYLQPGASWQTGRLRLQPTLMLQTPDGDWTLDLGTGHPALTGSATEADAIVQLNDGGWASHPQRLDHLRQTIIHELEQITPELQLLMEGTTVNLSLSSGTVQPATLRVAVAFSFLAMPRR